MRAAHSLDLKKETLAAIELKKTLQHYQTGQVLFYAGNHPGGIYWIKKGAVKLEAQGESGHAHLLHVVGAGGVLGYRGLLEDEPSQVSAIAREETELWFVSRSKFLEILKKDPDLALQVIESLTRELIEIENRLCHATDYSASERVAEALLFLKLRHQDQSWSRKDLADWAGTTPETVIRTLSRFEAQGLIKVQGRKITISDLERLSATARLG